MPNHVKFLPLDQTRLRGNSYLESHEMRAKVAAAGTNRPVSVIRWAHHDDGHYLGRPYLPNATFCTKLNGARSAGFGIIHWTTRPLDLYFDSLSRQAWQSTRDESIQGPQRVRTSGSSTWWSAVCQNRSDARSIGPQPQNKRRIEWTFSNSPGGDTGFWPCATASISNSPASCRSR